MKEEEKEKEREKKINIRKKVMISGNESEMLKIYYVSSGVVAKKHMAIIQHSQQFSIDLLSWDYLYLNQLQWIFYFFVWIWIYTNKWI